VYGDILTRYREIGGPDRPLGLPIAAPANAAKPARPSSVPRRPDVLDRGDIGV
jgi:hypothetical protein